MLIPPAAPCSHIPLPHPATGLFHLPFPPSETSRGDEQKPEVTRASSVPTHAPAWEEEVTVEMDAEDTGWAGESIGDHGDRGDMGLISSKG